ncbi:MAG: hypothetical protein SGILL_005881 [Bacillariaceae sp.]
MGQRKGSPAKGKKPSAAAHGEDNNVATSGRKSRSSPPPRPPPESPVRSAHSRSAHNRSAHSRTSAGPSPPRRNYHRDTAAPSLADGMKNRKSLNTWMTGGNLMKAPTKPKLTVPQNWTTRSGRFRPSESGWGFDARTTVGRFTGGLSVMAGSSFVSGIMGRGRVSRKDLNADGNDEIQDPEAIAAFQQHLGEAGIKPTIVVDGNWQSRSNISMVSMSDASYILDLAQQKQFRGKERQEEALEEAFILYKTALGEGADDDEQMFFMLLNEVKKELDEKYKEKDRKNDRDLDRALEAEMLRRERQQKGMRDSEHDQDLGIDVGRRKSKVSNLIDDEEYYHEVEERQQQHEKETAQSNNNLMEYSRGPRPEQKSQLNQDGATTKTSGFFSCCGKDVEDSVVIATTKTVREDESKTLQHRDPSFFKRLRKKQAEEEEERKKKREIELSNDDMWWEEKSVEVNVPEIDDDLPTTRTRGSKGSQDTLGETSNESPRSRKSEPLSLFQKSPNPPETKLRRRKSNPLALSPGSPSRKTATESTVSSLSSSEKKNESPGKKKKRSVSKARKRSVSPTKTRKSKSKSPKRSQSRDTGADGDKTRSPKKKGKLKATKSSDALTSPKKAKKKKTRPKSADPPGHDSSEFLYEEKPAKRKSKMKLSDSGSN